MTLGDVAHARAGDKGHLVNISVIAFDSRDYAHLARVVTTERVKAHMADFVVGDLVRYELPQLGALNFVLSRGVRDGVTQTLALDAHGKSLSSALLEMPMPGESSR